MNLIFKSVFITLLQNDSGQPVMDNLTPRGSFTDMHPGGGGVHRNTPPARLQHPMKPPHRLAEPVMRSPQYVVNNNTLLS